jgi:N-carbamoyl-L-amino-acid hydrolase
MMGSMVHQGQLPLDEMLKVRGIEGTTVADDLQRIGYAGEAPTGSEHARAFVELHVEQGPVLEREEITIGAVEGVQGISWTEVVFTGVSNHAGTTPMALRHDAGFAAASVAAFVRALATEMGGDQVATVGRMELSPNLVNVIARRALITVDLRNTDESLLREAEERLRGHLQSLADAEGLGLETRSLARFEPVGFDERVIAMVERAATDLGHGVRRMPSGAGHDAQSFAPNCPTGMVFVPSVGGISHNVKEFTATPDLEAGANVLLRVLLQLASE